MIQMWLLSSALICPENLSAFFWYQAPPAGPIEQPKIVERIVYVPVQPAEPVPAKPVEAPAVTAIEEKKHE